MILQLDGPRSLPIRDLTRGRLGRISNQIEQDLSQGGTHVRKATMIRRREYPEEGDGNDNYRRQHQNQRPLIEEDTLVEDSLIEMETPWRRIPW